MKHLGWIIPSLMFPCCCERGNQNGNNAQEHHLQSSAKERKIKGANKSNLEEWPSAFPERFGNIKKLSRGDLPIAQAYFKYVLNRHFPVILLNGDGRPVFLGIIGMDLPQGFLKAFEQSPVQVLPAREFKEGRGVLFGIRGIIRKKNDLAYIAGGTEYRRHGTTSLLVEISKRDGKWTSKGTIWKKE